MKEKLESKILNIFSENGYDEKYAKISLSLTLMLIKPGFANITESK